jgi:hypothetical protein
MFYETTSVRRDNQDIFLVIISISGRELNSIPRPVARLVRGIPTGTGANHGKFAENFIYRVSIRAPC